MTLQERILQLQQLMLDIDNRLHALERPCTACVDCKGLDVEYQVKKTQPQTDAHLILPRSPNLSAVDQGPASCTESRLAKELLEKGITHFGFKRVPEHYYLEDLEYRRDCLQAASIQHLCKSLVYENPKLPAEHECQDLRHCLVVVQVCLKLHIMMHLHISLLISACQHCTKHVWFKLCPWMVHPRKGSHPTSIAV